MNNLPDPHNPNQQQGGWSGNNQNQWNSNTQTQSWPNNRQQGSWPGNGNAYGNAYGGQVDSETAFGTLMRKVYIWMALALGITGLTSYIVASSPALLNMIFGSQIVFWGLMLAELGLVIAISAAISKLTLNTATLLFVLYSVINGATLSSIFLIYTSGSIAQVFFITAGTFAAMAFVGYTTKKDLSGMGRILIMALIGAVIATVVNIFVKSDGLGLILSYVMVVVFVGLTAYDTQKLKNLFQQQAMVNDSTLKIALLGALTLYLDFINLFLALLRIMGKRD